MKQPELICVRDVTDSDIPQITTIYRSAVLHGTASFELEAPDETEMQRRMEVIINAGNAYLVACAGERVVGYAYYAAYRPRPAYRLTIENSVYISPDAQGQGLGKLLLTQLIQRAETSGYRQMVAVIGDSANEASIGLHMSLGFRLCGTVTSVGFKHGRWLDQVIMQRSIGPGDSSVPSA